MSKELKEHVAKLQERFNRATKYMDALIGVDLSEEELKQAIKERENHIPRLQKLIKELDTCMRLLEKQ